MAFASNIAAMNAAKKFVKGAGFDANAYKEFFKIEKIDGEWHSLQIQAFPAPRDPLSCLMDEREGIFAFPLASESAELDLTEAQRQADAIANAQQSAAALPNGKEWIRVSSVEKPTKFVWHVADRMVAAALAAGKAAPSRKEVQDECVRLGVAHGTARTQYQAWKKACDEAALNAIHAAELSAKHNAITNGGKKIKID
jgi:hypothetical protein